MAWLYELDYTTVRFPTDFLKRISAAQLLPALMLDSFYMACKPLASKEKSVWPPTLYNVYILLTNDLISHSRDYSA